LAVNAKDLFPVIGKEYKFFIKRAEH